MTRLEPKEVTALIGCGYDKLMQLVRTKRIPHFRIGRRVFFTKEALTTWVENMQLQSVQPENKRTLPTIAK
ncbi:MAG: helix-turn-helix domain-containing protein [Desulfitobacteriaceae bacterium]